MGDAADDVYDSMLRDLADGPDDCNADDPVGWHWVCGRTNAPCQCAIPDAACPYSELDPVPAPF